MELSTSPWLGLEMGSGLGSGSGAQLMQGLVRCVLENIHPDAFYTTTRSFKHAVLPRITIQQIAISSHRTPAHGGGEVRDRARRGGRVGIAVTVDRSYS